MSTADEVVSALRAGEPVVLPTDTVYGLCADPYREGPTLRLAGLKGRDPMHPIALLAAELGIVLDAVPELEGRPAAQMRALLPGPYTLVLPNPARRFPWLTGTSPETIGIRVVDVGPEVRVVLDRVGVVAATSANRHGEPPTARVADLPAEIRSEVGAVIDAGELPGTASTVLDLAGSEPAVLREGGGSVSEALERLRAAG